MDSYHLTIFFFLSLSSPTKLSLSLSLTSPMSQSCLKDFLPMNCNTRRPTGFKLYRNPRARSLAAQSPMWRRVSCPWESRILTISKQLSPTITTSGSWSQTIHLNLLFKMVPLVPTKAYHWYVFPCNKTFATGFRSNKALFWGNDLEFVLVAKITFRWHMICLCLVPLTKSHIFETNRKNCQLKLPCFVCRANQDSKSESKIFLGLLSMPRIQWRSQN